MRSSKTALVTAVLASIGVLACPLPGTAAPTDSSAALAAPTANPPIYIAFLWHMHQPIYWPYESVLATEAAARYPYSVVDIFNQRTGPYTAWPKDAVQTGIAAGMGHFGAQVSLSGSLIENLDQLEAGGNANFLGWKSHWSAVHSQSTSLGNPRLDLVGFGYHHPLMGLLDTTDVRRQIRAHRQLLAARLPGAYSKGIFPPENAFAPRMIPALAAEGIEWVLVDNLHFDRAARGYPYSTAGNVYEPNFADVRNPDPGDWRALTGLWAPTQVSAGWGHRPHWVQHRDPATAAVSRVIAVPADRYMGNEDGRGGFGALQYDAVMSQLETFNTDAAHPLLVVLHHDGDNYGGGTDSYYHSNFQAFVSWLAANPSRFVCTTVQDYLELFPPAASDVIHVESGSWSGADNGDPEFKKWLGDPGAGGYSPDRNSWAVVTAARNVVQTAEQVAPAAAGTLQGWKYLLNAQASDYWYWDGAQDGIWDAHPTRACNQAVQHAQPVLAGAPDLTPPSLFVPQREPWNPGGTEWGMQQPSDFEVWTYAYDVSGLASVTLRYRLDADGVIAVDAPANDTYTGGDGVGVWIAVPCTSSDVPSQTDPQPLVRARRYAAQVTGLTELLVDYYIEAVDLQGNVARTPIQHVWVGASQGTEPSGVDWSPASPTRDEVVIITVHGTTRPAKLHWGVNGWALPAATYRPAGSTLFNGTGPAVETPLDITGGDMTIALGPFDDPTQPVSTLDFVLHYDDGSWDNNGGADWHVAIAGSTPGRVYAMDGALDAGIAAAASHGGATLWLDWNGAELYVATEGASGVGQDVFVFVAGAPGTLVAAPWAKSGQAAQWSAYLANESGNNWSGWFDQSGAVAKASGAVLEGTISLAGEWGAVPSTVFVAVGRYATPDGGALLAQVPGGNADGWLDGAEYFELALQPTAAPGVGPGAGPGATGPAGASPVLALLPASPNPSGTSTTVAWTLPGESTVTLDVYDARGRRVATLARGRHSAGLHQAPWDARAVANGVYYVVLQVGEQTRTQPVVLVR